jgi:Tfp pilus assembly protein PilX
MTPAHPTPPRRHRLPVKFLREDGITMIIALGVTFTVSLLLVAVFASTRSETHLASLDKSQKKAYYAAVAGIENYEYHLTEDGNYLSYCTSPATANTALNNYYKSGTKEQLKTSELSTAEVPAGKEGEASEESYAIELIPAASDKSTAPKCEPTHLVESMVEEEGAATGTFRIESTGFSGGEQRSLIATFRNANFVSYVWYSVYETGDPSLYGEVPPGEPSTYWDECGHFYEVRPARCNKFNNYFIGGESVNGPMHTQDHLGVCGRPVFGRSKTDRIEFGNGGNLVGEGYSSEQCGEAASPEFVGTHIPPSKVLAITPPPGDEELEHIVEPSYDYNGTVEIILEESTMTVKEYIVNAGKLETKTNKNVPYPPAGIIYVSGSCTEAYSPFGPKPGYEVTVSTATCGDVYVHGRYTNALTIAAQNDVIINGNITTPVNASGEPENNAMLGLIANNFVRVAHPVETKYLRSGTKCKEETYEGVKILDKTVAGSNPVECEYTNEAHLKSSGSEYSVVDACDAPNAGTAKGDINEPVIYAAILALKHSFIVDNFDCGKPEFGSIKLYGALAGQFTNGMTGVFSGKTSLSGYGYNLIYDNRLQVEEPPHFLNPIQAAWYVQRETLATNP